MRSIVYKKPLPRLRGIQSLQPFIPRFQQNLAFFSSKRKFDKDSEVYKTYLVHKAHIDVCYRKREDAFELLGKELQSFFGKVTKVINEDKMPVIIPFLVHVHYSMYILHRLDHQYYLRTTYGLSWDNSMRFLLTTCTFVPDYLLKFDWKIFLQEARTIVPILITEEWRLRQYARSIPSLKQQLLAANVSKADKKKIGSLLKEQEEESQTILEYFTEIACDSYLQRLRDILANKLTKEETVELSLLPTPDVHWEMEIRSFHPIATRHRVIGEQGEKSFILDNAQEEERRYPAGSVVSLIRVDIVADQYKKKGKGKKEGGQEKEEMEQRDMKDLLRTVYYTIFWEGCISQQHTPTQWIVACPLKRIEEIVD